MNRRTKASNLLYSSLLLFSAVVVRLLINADVKEFVVIVITIRLEEEDQGDGATRASIDVETSAIVVRVERSSCRKVVVRCLDGIVATHT